MKTKSVTLGSVGSVLAALFCLATIALPMAARAEANVVAVEGVGYNVNSSLADNLQSLVGKRVYVTLDSGKTFAGTVKGVGSHLVHLEKLDGKDFFDALIRLESITAIDTRFRDSKR